ncbi:MAG: CPBP family intramembrane glutamic endopeptidase, partial [Acidobacteriota bacterium]
MRSLLKFFLLTYIVSWTLWIAAAISGGFASPTNSAGAASPGSGLAAIGGFLYLLGVFAPALVALALTAKGEGRTGTMALLRRIVQAPTAVQWYVFAVGYFVAIKLAVALVYRLATGAWPTFSQEAWYLMAGAVIISTPAQAGEEIGWRGYALPRLTKQLGLARASIILGVFWASWHLPFFFIAGTDKSGQSFPVYLLAVTALSVAMAWLYWRTNGSLLLTMLMHAAVNNTNIVASARS